MHRAQPSPRPSPEAVRAALEELRALFVEVEAARYRIAKHHAALRLGCQIALVLLAQK